MNSTRLGPMLRVALAASILLAGCRPPAATPQAQSIDELAAGYLQDYYAAHPVRATALGIHDHDGRLPAMDAASLGERGNALRRWLDRLAAVDRASLTRDEGFDHRILEYAAHAELLELDEVREWQRNPMRYNRLVADGVATLIDRDFAPLDVRLEVLTRRLEAVPGLLAAGRENLESVPRLWAELALRSTQGTVAFLRDDVPPALAEQGFAEVAAAAADRFRAGWAEAIEATEGYARWLEQTVLPQSDGDFRLGEELFLRKLRYEEHVDLSLQELRDMNARAIADYRRRVTEAAARIDPAADPAAVMERITSSHPSPERLIETARRFVEQARNFVVEREIVTLPTEGLPTVRPMPRYARSGFASMSTPGPFETVATEAYYNITNVDPAWDARRRHEHLTYFNYPGLLGISIHEAMPGHFVQLLYRQRIASDVRRVFMPSSFVEGWAHYTEQMMIDEGLGDGEPAVRLGQLRRALQRHARWHAGIALHTEGASIEETALRFQEIALFAAFPALRETQRASHDPTYLYYALGRMEILRLRDDYRRQEEAAGRSFSLREFHDRLLEAGLPLSLARRLLLDPEE